MDEYVQILSDVSELSEIKDARGGKIRNRYVLVAVRSPDHHGLFVGDLAGGDGVDLLDVLDLGNGLHGCVFMCVIKVRKRWAPVLEESGRGSVSRKLFSWRHAFFFAAGGLVFFTSEVALRAPLQRENGKKSEEKKEGENEFF